MGSWRVGWYRIIKRQKIYVRFGSKLRQGEGIQNPKWHNPVQSNWIQASVSLSHGEVPLSRNGISKRGREIAGGGNLLLTSTPNQKVRSVRRHHLLRARNNCFFSSGVSGRKSKPCFCFSNPSETIEGLSSISGTPICSAKLGSDSAVILVVCFMRSSHTVEDSLPILDHNYTSKF